MKRGTVGKDPFGFTSLLFSRLSFFYSLWILCSCGECHIAAAQVELLPAISYSASYVCAVGSARG